MQLKLYCIVQSITVTIIAVLRLQQLSLSHNIFATYQQLSFSLKNFATNQQPSFIVSKLFATYQQLSFLTWAISLTLVRATIMSSVSRTMAGPAGCLPPLLFLGKYMQIKEMHQRREKTNIFALGKRNKKNRIRMLQCVSHGIFRGFPPQVRDLAEISRSEEEKTPCNMWHALYCTLLETFHAVCD